MCNLDLVVLEAAEKNSEDNNYPQVDSVIIITNELSYIYIIN